MNYKVALPIVRKLFKYDPKTYTLYTSEEAFYEHQAKRFVENHSREYVALCLEMYGLPESCWNDDADWHSASANQLHARFCQFLAEKLEMDPSPPTIALAVGELKIAASKLKKLP